MYFSVGTCLCFLLQQELLSEPEQRLAAITILHELYRGEPVSKSPFGSVFIHLLVNISIFLNITLVIIFPCSLQLLLRFSITMYFCVSIFKI